jgi:hypothetical protein
MVAPQSSAWLLRAPGCVVGRRPVVGWLALNVNRGWGPWFRPRRASGVGVGRWPSGLGVGRRASEGAVVGADVASCLVVAPASAPVGVALAISRVGEVVVATALRWWLADLSGGPVELAGLVGAARSGGGPAGLVEGGPVRCGRPSIGWSVGGREVGWGSAAAGPGGRFGDAGSGQSSGVRAAERGSRAARSQLRAAAVSGSPIRMASRSAYGTVSFSESWLRNMAMVSR